MHIFAEAQPRIIIAQFSIFCNLIVLVHISSRRRRREPGFKVVIVYSASFPLAASYLRLCPPPPPSPSPPLPPPSSSPPAPPRHLAPPPPSVLGTSVVGERPQSCDCLLQEPCQRGQVCQDTSEDEGEGREVVTF